MHISRIVLSLILGLCATQVALASHYLAAGTELKLPASLTAYSSVEGAKDFTAATNKASFWQLSRFFITQKNQAYCGVASLAIVLNALNVPRPYSSAYAPYRLYNQDNIFIPEVVKLFKPLFISGHGLTLQQLSQFAAVFPVTVNYYHADASDKAFERFKARTLEALSSNKHYVIVNFSRKGIKEVGGGHFSPLAAYDKASDRFLLMDVSRYKYPPVWVKAKTLWQAMATKDTTSKNNRGYLVFEAKSA